MGFGKFWKVMEIDNAIFQGLQRFGKEMILYNGYGKVWILFREILKYPEIDMA